MPRNSEQDVVKPGDLVVVKVGTAILYDNNFLPANRRNASGARRAAIAGSGRADRAQTGSGGSGGVMVGGSSTKGAKITAALEPP